MTDPTSPTVHHTAESFAEATGFSIEMIEAQGLTQYNSATGVPLHVLEPESPPLPPSPDQWIVTADLQIALDNATAEQTRSLFNILYALGGEDGELPRELALWVDAIADGKEQE